MANFSLGKHPHVELCDLLKLEGWSESGAQADDGEVAEIERLIQQRLDARKAKDWAAADAARDRLNEMGIVLEDGPQGTTWRRK
ncbi:hypothetical protein A3N52_04140 [Klebsiella aerogenes]|nr:hypothetical protein A3N42_18540 [Klebsiella aerogenes]KZQ23550.1 hypothetical protein A3N45_04175 [Klebsiella aerogenes]KZQ55033.1 hypothetical protein A3N61_11125 [Klebsiella aerogenes]KZQ82798.1 hypothetical protein A3N52_04140 [Klebsiella aerogenes]KZR23809.1 hypothetical protein A3N70_22625 [Klebsiella aerogenes]